MGEEQERPPAPGGPLRQDQPSGPLAPGLTPEGARDDDGDDGRGEAGSVPPPRGTDPEQDDGERDLQAENAETSLDQPSS